MPLLMRSALGLAPFCMPANHRTIRCTAARDRASIRQARKDLAAIGLQLCPVCEEVKKLEQNFGLNRRELVGRDQIYRQCRGRARNSSSAETAPAQP